jgi:hypothetical protein
MGTPGTAREPLPRRLRARTLATLAVGTLLWIELGAVRGAEHGQGASPGTYLTAVAVAGGLIGLLAPGPHLATGALLAVPAVLSLAVTGQVVQTVGPWWLVTVTHGGVAAALSHRFLAELRWRAQAAARPRLPPRGGPPAIP